MRHLLLALAFVIGLVPLAANASKTSAMPAAQTALQVAAARSLQLFSTPQAAQKHCPNDMVVWLNTRTGIYHYAGQRWYGNTEYGAYVCEKEAIAADDRATRKGRGEW